MSSSANILVKIFEALPDQEQKTLMDFAEFLQSRSPVRESVTLELLDIPRPDNESVVAAVKRLSRTYPMVERFSVFNEISDLMMQHLMQGRAAVEVIDELEQLFERKYRSLLEDCQ
jgi:hypothetical protein